MPEPETTQFSSKGTILFITILSFVCALILSVLASALQTPQEIAKELDRSKQMLIAARIVSANGYFQIENSDGKYIPAKEIGEGILVPGSEKDRLTNSQIIEVVRRRIKPFLVNDKGEESTFEKQHINEQEYIRDFRKTGYYKEPWKLVYAIAPNPNPDGKISPNSPPIEGYIFPINGYGLWDAIYGYLAVKTDGDTVIGISWYDQKETPGLGDNIAHWSWQSQFPGKKIFQPSADGKTDFATTPLGIVVVRGKVNEVYGNSPKAESAVDGMAGATLTGNGVTVAYTDALAPYRPFLIKIHKAYQKKEKKNE